MGDRIEDLMVCMQIAERVESKLETLHSEIKRSRLEKFDFNVGLSDAIERIKGLGKRVSEQAGEIDQVRKANERH
jgi:hypothetical protein